MEPPSKIRAFVAIHPPDAVRRELEKIQRRMQKEIPAAAIRWTAPEQIHLTTNFLGYIEHARLEDFFAALQTVSESCPAHSLRVASVGAFPSAKRARILWAGLSGEVEALQHLKSSLDQVLQPLGFVPEERAFHPHLTIARVGLLNSRERRNVGECIAALATVPFGEWRVKKIDFMQSVLSPQGAKYELLKSFSLR